LDSIIAATVRQPFDAALVIAFGGPNGPADVRPFLANVLRGRRIAPERIEEVAHHYELFGGVSPLTELTIRQAEGLRERLWRAGAMLPVHVGMRNWHPYLEDALSEMSRNGIRRAIGFIAAAHRSYSGCLQYRENVMAARTTLAERRLADVEITYVDDWYLDDGFITANVDHIREAIGRLPLELRARAHLVFTAHSIPVSMAERYPYQAQYEQTARLVAAAVGVGNFATVYQSRSGRPEDPWLGPDVSEYLRHAKAEGVAAVVLCPIGFLSDHIEVLYDLDVEAADVCRQVALPMARAQAVNTHPRFLDAMADAVLRTLKRYATGLPLEIAPQTQPSVASVRPTAR
jgi:protoporphyrin/coproporphyrin ferrochelatase